MSNKTKTLNVFFDGQVKAAYFRLYENDKTPYIAVREDMTFEEFKKEFGWDAKRVQGINLDYCHGGEFFLVYVSDCFDPPLTVIGANGGFDAQMCFIEETEYALIPEEDHSDFEEDDPDGEAEEGKTARQPSDYVYFDSQGRWHDTEQIIVRRVQLIRLDIV